LIGPKSDIIRGWFRLTYKYFTFCTSKYIFSFSDKYSLFFKKIYFTFLKVYFIFYKGRQNKFNIIN